MNSMGDSVNARRHNIPYPQAVPLKYVIDPDTCIYFKKGTCKACEKFCPTGAVDLLQWGKDREVAVGR